MTFSHTYASQTSLFSNYNMLTEQWIKLMHACSMDASCVCRNPTNSNKSPYCSENIVAPYRRILRKLHAGLFLSSPLTALSSLLLHFNPYPHPRGNWGPHLIIVPTSVMLNWELELKKWCPAFKILTYFGSFKERKQKRVVRRIFIPLLLFLFTLALCLLFCLLKGMQQYIHKG